MSGPTDEARFLARGSSTGALLRVVNREIVADDDTRAAAHEELTRRFEASAGEVAALRRALLVFVLDARHAEIDPKGVAQACRALGVENVEQLTDLLTPAFAVMR